MLRSSQNGWNWDWLLILAMIITSDCSADRGIEEITEDAKSSCFSLTDEGRAHAPGGVRVVYHEGTLRAKALKKQCRFPFGGS